MLVLAPVLASLVKPGLKVEKIPKGSPFGLLTNSVYCLLARCFCKKGREKSMEVLKEFKEILQKFHSLSLILIFTP